MTVSIILKGAIDKLGRQPLQIRINNGEDRRFLPTRIKVMPSEWDNKAMQVLPAHPLAKELNRKLRGLLLDAEFRADEKKPVKSPSLTLVQFVIRCLGEWEGVKKESTLKAQRTNLENIKGYDKTVLLKDVNGAWLAGYRSHLLKKGQKHNTMWNQFKFLRTVITKALREKLITDDPFLLLDGKPTYKKQRKNFLTFEQVGELQKLAASGVLTKAEQEVCTWFLISCFTGLRYSDMAGFDFAKMKGARLYLHTEKTGAPVSIQLPGLVLGLFDAVNYEPLSTPNQLGNRLLKRIATLAGIEDNMTWHTARHTCATLALASGVDLVYVQRMLGHEDIKTTQDYAKIIDTKQDEAYNKMMGRFQ